MYPSAWPPEAQLLAVNAAILAVAYLGIYPALREKTLRRMLACDLVLMAAALGLAAALFLGSGTRFSLLLFETNWLVFTLVTAAAMETPVFLWFARRHGIDLDL